MATRREFVQALPAVGTAFAVGGHLVLDDSPARAQGAAAPLAGHFHPKGKAPSKFTLDVLRQARGGLPFGDTRDFEEQKKGLIAPTLSPQRLRETELVTFRVGQVEEPLAPFGVARRRVRAIAGRDHARMQGIDVGMVEDDTSPPRPTPLRRLGDEIEIAASRPKARKRCVVATVNDLKSKHAIEVDGTPHAVGSQRDGTNALDHCRNAPKSPNASIGDQPPPHGAWHLRRFSVTSAFGGKADIRNCRANVR